MNYRKAVMNGCSYVGVAEVLEEITKELGL